MAHWPSVEANRDHCFVGIDDDAGGVEWDREVAWGL